MMVGLVFCVEGLRREASRLLAELRREQGLRRAYENQENEGIQCRPSGGMEAIEGGRRRLKY